METSVPGYVIELQTPSGGATGTRVYANRDVARRAARRLNDDLSRLGFGSEWSTDYVAAEEMVSA
jgi:hypothetical protein